MFIGTYSTNLGSQSTGGQRCSTKVPCIACKALSFSVSLCAAPTAPSATCSMDFGFRDSAWGSGRGFEWV